MNLPRYLIHTIRLTIRAAIFIIWQSTFISISLASDGDIKEPMKIGSYLTPGVITEDGTGIFNKLNKAIFMEINKNSQLTLSSLNRVRKGV